MQHWRQPRSWYLFLRPLDCPGKWNFRRDRCGLDGDPDSSRPFRQFLLKRKYGRPKKTSPSNIQYYDDKNVFSTIMHISKILFTIYIYVLIQPAPSRLDFNGISWKRVRWMTRLKQPHGTLRLFSRNRLVRWKADSKRTVVTWWSICVNNININKQQNTHGNKRFWQLKWKNSLILGRNGPFCVF